MSLSMRIAAHLPYLRRFSRAITGSQASGDAYVAAVLEALIADIALFPKRTNDRVSLFKLFCSLFETITIDLPDAASPFGWEKRAAANLSMIAARRPQGVPAGQRRRLHAGRGSRHPQRPAAKSQRFSTKPRRTFPDRSRLKS